MPYGVRDVLCGIRQTACLEVEGSASRTRTRSGYGRILWTRPVRPDTPSRVSKSAGVEPVAADLVSLPPSENDQEIVSVRSLWFREQGRSSGAVAQLGEHLLCKQGVVGSIPSGSTRYPGALLLDWFFGQSCCLRRRASKPTAIEAAARSGPKAKTRRVAASERQNRACSSVG